MSQQEINGVHCIVCIYNFKHDVVVEWGLPIVSECEEHMRAYKLHTNTETVHNVSVHNKLHVRLTTRLRAEICD